MKPKTSWLVVSLLVGLTLDQATKAWTRTLGRRDEVEVIPGWLSLVHAQNPGAAFSMLADWEYRLWVFGLFAVVTVIGLGLAWRATEDDDRWTGLAIGLFLTGALGNTIDRLYEGHVTDMVKVYLGAHGPTWWRELHLQLVGSEVYPIWNVADAAIVIGVPLYLISTVFKKDSPAPAEPEAGDQALSDPLLSDTGPRG